MNSQVLVFDLDDTLHPEIDFLKSAYAEIADQISVLIKEDSDSIYKEMLQNYNEGHNVFVDLIAKYSLYKNVEFFLKMYRNHKPNISLNNEKKEVLDYLKSKSYILGLLTDGRSVQQRHKIEALGIGSYFNDMVISEEFGSEKPNMKNYLYFQNKFPNKNYTYIGDNTRKDFISANALNWKTICLLDKGENIHKQNFNVSKEFLPQHQIGSFKEILQLIE